MQRTAIHISLRSGLTTLIAALAISGCGDDTKDTNQAAEEPAVTRTAVTRAEKAAAVVDRATAAGYTVAESDGAENGEVHEAYDVAGEGLTASVGVYQSDLHAAPEIGSFTKLSRELPKGRVWYAIVGGHLWYASGEQTIPKDAFLQLVATSEGCEATCEFTATNTE